MKKINAALPAIILLLLIVLVFGVWFSLPKKFTCPVPPPQILTPQCDPCPECATCEKCPEVVEQTPPTPVPVCAFGYDKAGLLVSAWCKG